MDSWITNCQNGYSCIRGLLRFTFLGETIYSHYLQNFFKFLLLFLMKAIPRLGMIRCFLSWVEHVHDLHLFCRVETLKDKLFPFFWQHRVCSLESCDKIIVLSKGVIIEQGSPSDLKEDASSAFAGMLEQNQLWQFCSFAVLCFCYYNHHLPDFCIMTLTYLIRSAIN